MTLKYAGLTGVLLGVSALAGCGGGFYAARVNIGPPPPPVYGYVGVAPGPGYIWTDGYYDLRGGRWFWVNGRWVVPPYPHARWERPYWERHGNGYRFHEGRWRR